ncbi:type II secretion system protein [Pelomonas sp. APW6]|uniref:Type II secretion system protein n=1 Tax=Roseateles subflavus TaxID=3053353 RepID=A0ABT7LNR7_9BURK|nr:type II secretion system protein [Pelomonas sp. APW6]MDL5034522.1 type II secretion system protein [Pelomonas sp. APW6]
MRKNNQAGFTLIELVMVIVILGALAAIALPKFVDFGSDAKAAAVQGVAGALSSASAINYAQRKLNSSNGSAVTNCTSVGPLLQAGALPSGYTITSAPIAADATNAGCVVTGPGPASAAFTATGIL